MSEGQSWAVAHVSDYTDKVWWLHQTFHFVRHSALVVAQFFHLAGPSVFPFSLNVTLHSIFWMKRPCLIPLMFWLWVNCGHVVYWSKALYAFFASQKQVIGQWWSLNWCVDLFLKVVCLLKEKDTVESTLYRERYSELCIFRFSVWDINNIECWDDSCFPGPTYHLWSIQAEQKVL